MSDPAPPEAESIAPPATAGISQAPPAEPARPPREVVERAPAQEEPDAGSYGAPIAEPMIPQFNEQSPDPVPSAEDVAEVVEQLPPPAPVPVDRVRPPEPEAPDAQETQGFGAPIGEPVLDPQRHGGDAGD